MACVFLEGTPVKGKPTGKATRFFFWGGGNKDTPQNATLNRRRIGCFVWSLLALCGCVRGVTDTMVVHC